MTATTASQSLHWLPHAEREGYYRAKHVSVEQLSGDKMLLEFCENVAMLD